MAAEVVTEFIVDFLALADVMVYMGIVRRLIHLYTRGLQLVPLLDAA